MADVFISYSHANVDFARRLAQELKVSNYDLWIDLEGIRFNADWWDEIQRGIENSNNILVVMSPNSLGSPVCHLEIEYARKLSKRIILINHLPVDRDETSRMMLNRLASDPHVNAILGDRNPMTLFENNWAIIVKYQRVNFSYDASKSAKFRAGQSETEPEQAAREAEEAAFLQHFTDLRTALETDLEHINFHTRLGLRTRDWQRSHSNQSFLLFGDELTQAEHWLVDYDADSKIREKSGDVPKLPKPTDDHRTYVQASHVAELARTQRLSNIRRAGIGAGLAAIITLIFAVVASLVGVNAVNNANATLTPIAQLNKALADSSELMFSANAILKDDAADKLTAVLLGIRALKFAHSPEANSLLVEALGSNKQKMGFATSTDVTSVAFAPDGHTIATGLLDGTLILWDLATRQAIHTFQVPQDASLASDPQPTPDEPDVSVTTLPLITSMAFAPNGDTILVRLRNNTAFLWDVSTGQIIQTIKKQQELSSGETQAPSESVTPVAVAPSKATDNFPYPVAIAPDNHTAVIASSDGTAILWDLTTQEPLHTLSLSYKLAGVPPVSPAVPIAPALPAAPENAPPPVAVPAVPVNAPTAVDVPTPVKQLVPANRPLPDRIITNLILSVAFAPDSQTVLTGTLDGTIVLWDVKTGQSLRTFSTSSSNILGVAFSPYSPTIITIAQDGSVISWDVKTGQSLHTFAISSFIQKVIFSTDGRTILTLSGGGSGVVTAARSTIVQWDLYSSRMLRTFYKKANIYDIAFAPDGRTFLTGSSDSTAILWDVSDNLFHRIYSTRIDPPSAIAPDGRTAVTISYDSKIIYWDVINGQVLRVLVPPLFRINSMTYLPDGQTLLISGSDVSKPENHDETILWDLTTGQSLKDLDWDEDKISPVTLTNTPSKTEAPEIITNLQGPSHIAVNSLAISQDGHEALGGLSNGKAILWDLTTGQLIQILDKHEDSITSVAIAPDGKTALTGSEDATAILWDLTTGQPIHILAKHEDIITSVAIAPDGKTALTGSIDRTYVFWNLTTGQPIHRFDTYKDTITHVAFSPDGITGLVSTRDSTAILRELFNDPPTVIRTLNSTNSTILFSTDARHVLQISRDETVRLWDVEDRDFIDSACTQIWRDFTAEERTNYKIKDHEPTCPQFASPEYPVMLLVPTSTPLPMTLPVWTPIASPTAAPTITLYPSQMPTLTATYPGVLLTFTPGPTPLPPLDDSTG